MIRHKQCTNEERLQAVRRVINGEPGNVVAEDYNVSPSTISLWKKGYLDDQLRSLSKGIIEKATVGSKEGEVANLQKHPELEDELFMTESLQVAAILYQMKKDIVKVEEGRNNKKVIFFKNDDDIKTIVQKYFNHDLRCSPHEFFKSIYEVKKVIFPRV